MRVCIDATSLLVRSAGVKNYVYHWMRSLQSEAPQIELTMFPMLGSVGDLNHERSQAGFWQTIPRIALLHFLNIRFNPSIDALMGRVDVFHASSLLRNVPKRTQLTGTIYDMTVHLFPQFHTKGNVRAETSYYDRVLRRADGLIAISQSAKADAVRLLGLDPEKIAVIYPGVDDRYFSAAPLKTDRPYLLFVGTVEPRKNVDRLLDAWLAMRSEIRNEAELRIAGPIGWASGSTVDRLLSGLPGVRVLGYVPESDLPALIAGARGFVYPSLYEGFGFPLAQAMAAGVPCITSNVSSLPEVAGDSALLVEPQSTEQITFAMELLLQSTSLREELGRKGRERAKRFTWKNSAERSAEFFESL